MSQDAVDGVVVVVEAVQTAVGARRLQHPRRGLQRQGGVRVRLGVVEGRLVGVEGPAVRGWGVGKEQGLGLAVLHRTGAHRGGGGDTADSGAARPVMSYKHRCSVA